MPAGSSDVRRSTTASTAPASRISRPCAVVACAQPEQPGTGPGAGRVEVGAHRLARERGCGGLRRGEHHRDAGRRQRCRAASTFVAMPPRPTPAAGATDARRRPGPAGPRTSGTIEAPARRGGRRTARRRRTAARARRACTRCATSAASRSLSPKRISSVATVSFSLTIGNDAELEQAVEGALRVAVVGAPCDVVGGEQHLPDGQPVAGEGRGVARRRAAPWPTLAAACWVARSRGRRLRPSGPGRRRWRRRRPAPPRDRRLRCSASVVDERVDRGRVDPPVGGQRRRADLDDDPVGVRHRGACGGVGHAFDSVSRTCDRLAAGGATARRAGRRSRAARTGTEPAATAGSKSNTTLSSSDPISDGRRPRRRRPRSGPARRRAGPAGRPR